MEITGKLENWYMEQVTRKEFIIWGHLSGDSKGRWPDGRWIHTSGVKNRRIKEGDIVRTRNSTYLLGKPFKVI